MGRRYVEKECYEKDNGKKKEDFENNKKFFDLIKELYSGKVPTFIIKQHKNYLDKGYSSKGLYQTLHYVHKVINKPVLKGKPSIGLIPYYYDTAINHYEDIEKRRQKMEEEVKEKTKEAAVREVVFDKSIPPIIKKRHFPMLDD